MAFYDGILSGLIRGGTLARGALGELIAIGRDSGVLPVVNYVSTAASTAVTNTTDTTMFDKNYTIPAGSLRSGSRIKIAYQGRVTGSDATDTLAVELRIGAGVTGTALISQAARDVANDDIFTGQFEGVIRTVGTSGTLVGRSSAPAQPNAAGTSNVSGYLASTTINTTIAQLVGVTATWSAASTTNTCRLDYLSVEIA